MCMVQVLGAVPGPLGQSAFTPKPVIDYLCQLESILFDACSDCWRSQAEAMSALPQGVLAAYAVKANSQKRSLLDPGTSEFVFEHPPLKYSSKLMNSVWGLYNRYSVHNFKKNMNVVEGSLSGVQQQRNLLSTQLEYALYRASLYYDTKLITN